MEKFRVEGALTILITSFIVNSEGLNCYTCAHIEKGNFEGYEMHESCKWGSKPDDKFLQSCLQEGEDNNNGNIFDFVCTEAKIDGYSNKGDNSSFLGTFRGCGARLVGTTKQNLTGGRQKVTKECLQGRLSTVVAAIKNPTAKEYISVISGWFEDSSLQTNVKFCSCNSDACWETREELPGVNEGVNSGGYGDGSKPHVTLALFVTGILQLLVLLKFEN